MLQFSWALDFTRSGPSVNVREEIDRVYHADQNSSADSEGDFLVLNDESLDMAGPGMEEGEEEGGSDAGDSMRSLSF